MVPVFGICGLSGSGKTTLVERVLAELTGRGLMVGAIKHHGHSQEAVTCRSSKDTARLFSAGANPVALVHAGGVMLTRGPEAAGWSINNLTSAYFPGMDLVLVEGYKHADIPKIELVAPGQDPVLPDGGKLLATVGREGWGRVEGLDYLDADDPVAVADYIMQHAALKDPPKQKVIIESDGRALEVNPFVQNIVAGVLRGLISSLKGGLPNENLVIRLEKSDD
jgi:molybdopterin-guanine dinucleotide biosynthesis protein MobB